MCQRCYDFAMCTLLDRMLRRPDTPRDDAQEFEPEVLALMEVVFTEALSKGATQEEFDASAARMLARLMSAPTDIVHRLRDLIRVQWEFLDATEDMLLMLLEQRARAGDRDARMSFEKSGLPVHVIDLDRLAAERKRRAPETN